MGGTKKLSKFILKWRNGTRVACYNCANGAGNVHPHSCISVMDKVKINEQNSSIAIHRI